MNNFLSLHHISIIASDLDASLHFYCDILGMELDHTRPEMAFNGAWLKIGENQQIHLLQLSDPDKNSKRPEHAGRDRHMAIAISDITSVINTLVEHDIPFSRSRSGRSALFFRDPDNNGIEIVSVN